MQKHGKRVLYSASDLVGYLECEHRTTLDLIDLDTKLPRTADSDEAKLFQKKGHAHEGTFFESLKARHDRVTDIAKLGGSLSRKAANTLQAMREGHDIIFQATLLDGCLVGHADFLRKVAIPSKLGGWSYEVLDTKLARSPKAKFLVQLGFYSLLLERAQGVAPKNMHVVLGDGTEACFRCLDYAKYVECLIQRFMARVQGEAIATYPVPCEKCDQCKWADLCEARRLADDHLCQVANITRIQIKKLEAACVSTVRDLAALREDAHIPNMTLETRHKLHHQARLQYQARQTGQRIYERLPVEEGALRGFARLPRPDEGDLFFDMEGDPLEEGGLEYLFGLYFSENGEARFKAFWAHDRAEEKRAFQGFMDFVTDRLRRYPHAHIYHYAHYEETALKKLMSLHGTREAEMDNLLRARKLVDLYKVVREGLRVSEPRYSIKNIEHFYLEDRTSDVKSAGASIVYYEHWKETRNPQLLRDIEDYNHDDVRSTYELHKWLLRLRPKKMAWANEHTGEEKQSSPSIDALTEIEQKLIAYREALIDPLPADRNDWDAQGHLRELTFQLLDFHRRAAKPAWWSMFSRRDAQQEDLLEDGECLADLRPDPEYPPNSNNRSVTYTYLYPEQDTKLKTGDAAAITATARPVNHLLIDDVARRVRFSLSRKDDDPLPEPLSLGPGMPVATRSIAEAIFRFADNLIAQQDDYPAVSAFLRQDRPRIKGRKPGAAIVPPEGAAMADIIDAVVNLDESYLFIQGPPGAGKTYTGSHVIVALMKQGCRIGVTSNSHKAIHNLLSGVEKVARKEGFDFSGCKKASRNKEESNYDGEFISNAYTNEEASLAVSAGNLLVAGTAWLFADDRFDRALDYLFIDEAGQVAVANLVAMGTSTRNIVLLGDQMQLGQPIQGVHPGRSGESALDYLLGGTATIPPDRGIFLDTTWRMHPDVCRFISDAVYDSRLHPEPSNATQALLLTPDAHPALRPTGVRYLPIEHDACSQRSEEEGTLARELVDSLLRQRYRDKQGNDHPMTLNDILVVAPYNMQVNLLKRILPEGAHVGTVDKFQGQEAEVVIVSMATSSGEYLPRHIEFLYSKNRLNVAISRAKCLALFIANPALMAIRCTTPEQMGMVNTLCWVRDFFEEEL